MFIVLYIFELKIYINNLIFYLRFEIRHMYPWKKNIA